MLDSAERFRPFESYANPEYKNPKILKEKSLAKAQEFFDKNLPNIEIFKDVEGYDPRMYERDVAYTKKLENLNSGDMDEDKQWSVIQEAIILNELEMSNWFGDSVRTIRPTNHADFVQKVDGILKFEDKLVAFDATFKKQPYDKVHLIKNKLDAGELNPITYFYDEETSFKGSTQATGIVLGFDRENLLDVTEDWLYSQEGVPGSKKNIAEHPVQMQLLYQALMQFSAYELHSKSNNHEDLTEMFSEFKKQILETYNNKVKDNENLKNFELDSFTETLCNDISREYNIDLSEIKNNIWPKRTPGKVIKLPRKPPENDQFKKAA